MKSLRLISEFRTSFLYSDSFSFVWIFSDNGFGMFLNDIIFWFRRYLDAAS